MTLPWIFDKNFFFQILSLYAGVYGRNLWTEREPLVNGALKYLVNRLETSSF